MTKRFFANLNRTVAPYCPQCQALCDAVGCATLDITCSHACAKNFGNDGWFCTYPDCEVAYFDLYGRIILVEELRQPVHPKSDGAPICPALVSPMNSLTRPLISVHPPPFANCWPVQTPAANCTVLAANGRAAWQKSSDYMCLALATRAAESQA